jgi:hypothetical protein
LAGSIATGAAALAERGFDRLLQSDVGEAGVIADVGAVRDSVRARPTARPDLLYAGRPVRLALVGQLRPTLPM